MRRHKFVVAVAIVLAVVLVSTGCRSGVSLIKTPYGNYQLMQVQSAASFNGQPAQQGYAFLVVKFGRIPRGGLISEDVEYVMNLKGVYLTSGDGTRLDKYFLSFDEGGGNFAFTVPSGAKGFTLHWPGNDPIELGK